MLIVFDANVLHGDPTFQREPAKSILELLPEADATLVFSPVVLAELRRQQREKTKELAQEIQTRLRRLGRLAATSTDELSGAVETALHQADRRWEERIETILRHPYVQVDDWPDVDTQRMVERELSRRRPFLDKEPGTIGHRDTVIWLGVVQLACRNLDQTTFFVTADKGFMSGKQLHPDLLEDLMAAGVDPKNVRHLTSLAGLVASLEREAENVDRISWRQTTITELLYEVLQSFGVEDFAPTWDARDGGLREPTYDIGLPPVVEDWSISAIEGPTSVEIEDAPAGADELTCSFVAEISFSGFMDKFEWYSDDHPEVELWDGDWNDQYVSVDAQRRIKVEVALSVDDEDEFADLDEVTSVKAEAAPLP